MAAGSNQPRTGQTVKYEQLVTNTAIPLAMSRLWLTGRPDKEGTDSRNGESLQLWGLSLEQRRKDGKETARYPSITAFRNHAGQFYHEYFDELYYQRLIDITGRLWVPLTPSDGHYTDRRVGYLREFVPCKCNNWSELRDWNYILRHF